MHSALLASLLKSHLLMVSKSLTPDLLLDLYTSIIVHYMSAWECSICTPKPPFPTQLSSFFRLNQFFSFSYSCSRWGKIKPISKSEGSPSEIWIPLFSYSSQKSTFHCLNSFQSHLSFTLLLLFFSNIL